MADSQWTKVTVPARAIVQAIVHKGLCVAMGQDSLATWKAALEVGDETIHCSTAVEYADISLFQYSLKVNKGRDK